MSTDAQHLTRARFVELERQLAAAMAGLEQIESGRNLDGFSASWSDLRDMARAAIAKVQS